MFKHFVLPMMSCWLVIPYMEFPHSHGVLPPMMGGHEIPIIKTLFRSIEISARDTWMITLHLNIILMEGKNIENLSAKIEKN